MKERSGGSEQLSEEVKAPLGKLRKPPASLSGK